ncbi:MAG TPA: pilus assembly protein N-terminal domain-containing protein [Vicinamibacterales bacterium]|jgi:pilus assembly protein CpaC|nr:pilus assembly protein N-terminal domain-containing protein [Vicinamibacterales bacterium]
MRAVRRGLVKRAIALAAYIIIILVAAPSAQQQQVAFTGAPGAISAGPAAETPEATAIDLLVGRSTILNVGSTISRVSLTVPDVADAMVTTPQQLLIHGKTPGTISLFVWDKAGGIKTYEVNVRRDLSQLVEQVKQLFPGEPITVTGSGKDVVLAGTVSTKYVVDKAADVAAGYVEKKENVVNLLKQAEGVTSNQVMLRVRFAEVSRSAMQEIGASYILDQFKSDWDARATTQQFSAPDFDADKPGRVTFSDFLNIFLFNSKHGVGTVIRALQNKGLFQSLAEPNLIASNGKEASFLAGGEYPYPVVQPGGSGNAVTIMFKEFGVRLNFTPTVLSGDMISLKVRPEVSALDFSNAITLEGFRVPALSTRRTETEVELQDGQTFAIAGLMNNTLNNTMSKIPGIGDIPVLGYLFRSRAYQKQQTELVVMITPQIVRRGSTGVSEGLPSLVEPYMGGPSKTVPPPTPYVGSPRFPATQPRTGGSNKDQAQKTSSAPADAATIVQPTTMQPASAAAQPSSMPEQPNLPEQTPAAVPQSMAPAADQSPAEVQPKPMTKDEKRQADAAAKKQAEADKKAAEVKAAAEKKAAEEKAEADRKAAAEKAEADKKSAKDKERQQKLDQERAKREAEVAKKNAEADRKKQDEQKKKDKALTDAAARLREAQAAYQAEVAKTSSTPAAAPASTKPGGGR